MLPPSRSSAKAAGGQAGLLAARVGGWRIQVMASGFETAPISPPFLPHVLPFADTGENPMNGDICVGEWLVQPRLARASKGGQTVHLRAKVADLLVFLAQHPGEVISKDVLLDRVWGTEHISESALTSVVTELRQTLGDDPAHPWLLQTIPKQGYRLIAPVGPASESAIEGSATPRWRVLATARAALLTGAGVGVVLLAIWFASYRAEPPHSHAVARATVDVNPAESLSVQGPLGYLTGRPMRTSFTLSPDGRLLVFSAVDKDDRPQLYLRQLDELTARPIPGTERAVDPVFSLDGRWVAYWVHDPNIAVVPQHGDLLKVPLDGAPPVRLTSISRPFGLSWMPDGSIVVGTYKGGLLRVSQAGGEPVPVTRLRDGERSHRLPQVVSSGRSVLYTVLSAITRLDDAFVAVEDLASGERRKLVDGADGRYVEPGYLAFLQLGRMMVAPFDRERLHLTGAPIAAEFEVMQAIGFGNDEAESGAGQFAASATGVMAYLPGGITPAWPATLGWVHRDGRFEPVGAPAGNFTDARLSPDGRYAALSEGWKRWAVWVYDLQRGSLTPVEIRDAWAPLWAPRTGRLVVTTPNGLFWSAPHLSGGVQTLFTTADGEGLQAAEWTRDENTLIAVRSGDILAFSVQKGTVAAEQKLIATPAEDAFPALSPDGTWLAYTSTIEGDRMQVFVQPFPDLKRRWQVSTAGGQAPCWGPQGTELFYLHITNNRKKTLMRATFLPGDPPTFGRPEPLFDFTPYENTLLTRSFDISPDGKRFLVLRSDYPAHLPAPSRINLVLNWDEELKRRLARD